VPPEYKEVDIGEERPVPCLKFGLWLLKLGRTHFLVLLNTQHHQGIQIQVASPQGGNGPAASQKFLRYIEDAIQKGLCYRAKILSLNRPICTAGNRAASASTS